MDRTMVREIVSSSSYQNDDIDRAVILHSGITDSDFVCERCVAIRWELMAEDSTLYEVIEQSEHELLKSTCRVCRFFGKVVRRHSIRSYRRLKHYTLRHVQLEDFVPPNNILIAFDEHHPRFALPHIAATGSKLQSNETKCCSKDTSKLDLDRINSWINICVETHGEICHTISTKKLKNLKLIDCAKRSITVASEALQFGALSYVWNTTNPVIPQQDDSLDNVPNVVEDAIKFVQMLGYNYLWVDRYCIDQTNATEVQEQIAQMAAIYSAAHFTIIASMDDPVQSGLPGVQPCSRGGDRDSEIVGNSTLLNISNAPSIAPIQHSMWATRAWTVQECYFSRRRLFFTDDQVIFVCNSKLGFEFDVSQELFAILGYPGYYRTELNLLDICLPPQAPIFDYDRTSFQAPDEMDMVCNLLETYSARDLSFEDDALRAIAGALDTFAEVGFRHAWGVPMRKCTNEGISESVKHSWDKSECNADFELLLAWHHDKQCSRRSIFPSWSPLGWKGPVSYRTCSVRHNHELQEEIGTKFGLTRSTDDLAVAEHDITAQHQYSQYLQVDARMAQFIIASPKGDDKGDSKQTWVRLASYPEIVCFPHWDTEPIVPPEEQFNRIFKGLLLSVVTYKGHPSRDHPSIAATILLLEFKGAYYERVGLCTFRVREAVNMDTADGVFWWDKFFEWGTVIIK